jgi:hypothetical protein
LTQEIRAAPAAHRPFEIICVDDGSTGVVDRSAKALTAQNTADGTRANPYGCLGWQHRLRPPAAIGFCGHDV